MARKSMPEREIYRKIRFTFEDVDESEIIDFSRAHSGESDAKHWVVFNFGWSRDYPIFTFGVATCLALVLINEKNGEVGLGHIPYFYDPRLPKDTSEYRKINEAITKCRQEKGWNLYLYGGHPLPGNKDRIWFDGNHRVINMFNQAGVQCHNRINNDPDIGLAIIVDPVERKVKVAKHLIEQEI